MLLANSYGNVIHYVTAGTPTGLPKTLRDVLDKSRVSFGNGYAVGFEEGSFLSDHKTTSDKVICNRSDGKETGGWIGTGSELRLYGESGEVTDKALSVVKGDVDGDGVITVTDYITVRMDLIGKTKLGGAYALAADADSDGNVDFNDYINIRPAFLDITELK